ncbi:MAG: hypothetical protein M1817_003037 [Caeruleum heppii]|nr:MAG: hypothetical protein M1817_003037 [Caeruleum heppii]
MARKPRAAAQAAVASMNTPTPLIAEASDEEMIEAPVSRASTPQDEATPAHNSDGASEPSTPLPSSQQHPRKRRLGRPPKNKGTDRDTPDDSTNNDAGSEAGTPLKRRRGRPTVGGGRWGKPKGGPSHVTQVPIDKEGNMMDVIDDEVAMPPNSEGERKVDKMGHLQDGRAYRCRTFTIKGRGERLYMLSTEPARCIGFRDSYLFFQKHKQLYKIIIDEPAKRDLIDRQLIPHSYKGRAIGVVTARSVFREFGARIVVGGRKVIDDYHADTARANGEIEGELADPHDKLPKHGEEYNQNQYVAWHGASSVYHSGAPSVPVPAGKALESKKRRVVMTDANWMLEHARDASQFNASLANARKQNWNGVYDSHTNMLQYPQITQPTHVRWEHLPSKISPTSTYGRGADDFHDSGLDTDDSTPADPISESSIFVPLDGGYLQNHLVIETHFVTPITSTVGLPGPDAEGFEFDATGLDAVSDDILAELPGECLRAFQAAKEQEQHWKSNWSVEAEDGSRAKLRIGY